MLLVSILTPAKSAVAGDIDNTKARQAGAYFLASQFGDKAITAQSLEQVYEIRNTERDVAALYVFNTANKRGFVVVSGSDCVNPIVAYSTEGSFDPTNIAPSLQWWLNDQAKPIIYAQNNDIVASAESAAAWKVLEEERLPYFGQNSKAITRLLTSKWNQEPLYNNMCPTDAGGRCVTGCVATAMAQIIYYWKYPRTGKYTHAYSWDGTVLEVNFAEAYYDYDNMVDELTSASTQEQINAVALLNYHCGVSVDMSYSSNTSGASSNSVENALKKFFKYAKDSTSMITRSDTRYNNPNSTSTPNSKDTLWVNDIKAQIMKGRPVYYSGYSPSSGEHDRHAFVCDGWNDANSMMHFNWGWGGSGDCWCNVYKSKLQPSGNMSYYNFTSEHKALLGITPPKDSLPDVGVLTVEEPTIAEIYPNPAKEQIIVSYRLTGNANSEMQVFDIAGREVKRIAVSPASNYVTVSVGDLRPGVYICRLQGHSSKFIVK